jgi:hypothetical protein
MSIVCRSSSAPLCLPILHKNTRGVHASSSRTCLYVELKAVHSITLERILEHRTS